MPSLASTTGSKRPAYTAQGLPKFYWIVIALLLVIGILGVIEDTLREYAKGPAGRLREARFAQCKALGLSPVALYADVVGCQFLGNRSVMPDIPEQFELAKRCIEAGMTPRVDTVAPLCIIFAPANVPPK